MSKANEFLSTVANESAKSKAEDLLKLLGKNIDKKKVKNAVKSVAKTDTAKGILKTFTGPFYGLISKGLELGFEKI